MTLLQFARDALPDFTPDMPQTFSVWQRAVLMAVCVRELSLRDGMGHECSHLTLARSMTGAAQRDPKL